MLGTSNCLQDCNCSHQHLWRAAHLGLWPCSNLQFWRKNWSGCSRLHAHYGSAGLEPAATIHGCNCLHGFGWLHFHFAHISQIWKSHWNFALLGYLHCSACNCILGLHELPATFIHDGGQRPNWPSKIHSIASWLCSNCASLQCMPEAHCMQLQTMITKWQLQCHQCSFCITKMIADNHKRYK